MATLYDKPRHYYMIGIDNDDASLTAYNILRESIEAWLNTIVADENIPIKNHNDLVPDDLIHEYTLADIKNAYKFDYENDCGTVTLEHITYHIFAVEDIE